MTIDRLGEKGPYTYLNGHANSHANGWPQDHSVEDTFDVPPKPWEFGTYQDQALNEAYIAEACKASHPVATIIPVGDDESEYYAEFGSDGSARLCLTNTRIIGRFDTFADAKLAAEALNNLKGW
jgi:hypothetical protein